MNITRLGFIFLIVGAILLLNSWSEHVAGNIIYGSVQVNVTETDGYVMFMPPVGYGNLTVGFHRYSDVYAPGPPGSEDSVVVPVHIQVDDPANRTIIDEYIVTPYSFEVDFSSRGLYKVYLTNNGNETAWIPIGLRFKQGNPQNREADKYVLSIILTALGGVIIVAGFAIDFFKKQKTAKQYNKRLPKVKT
jgi:hypothetical protein